MMGWAHPWGREGLELPSRSGVAEPRGWNVARPGSKFVPVVTQGLWLLPCQPFPLGIPNPRAPALRDFPVLSRVLTWQGGREGMKILSISSLHGLSSGNLLCFSIFKALV